jgi:hypothetical protein
MGIFDCCGNTLTALGKAAAKSAASRLRRLGLLRQASDWASRASICETCHLRHVYKGASYCGRPFLQQIDRDNAEDGCGCPVREKARAPPGERSARRLYVQMVQWVCVRPAKPPVCHDRQEAADYADQSGLELSSAFICVICGFFRLGALGVLAVHSSIHATITFAGGIPLNDSALAQL